METEKILKSSQEQAVGAWVNYLNQVRLDRLSAALAKQNENLETAIKTLDTAFATIKNNIILRNRGGEKGMHGFIAEIAECGIGNARKQIIGKAGDYVWINDNGPDDFLRGFEKIQQKFVQSGGHLSLRAVAEHLHYYPEYLNDGYKYQIPKDHYDKVMAYLKMSADDANKLPTSTGDFSRCQWQEVHDFFENNNIDPDKLEPAILEYSEVQQGTIADTIDSEKKHLQETDRKKRESAYQDSNPTMSEGIKVAGVAAVTEGLTTFTVSVIHKRKSGKKIKDFEQKDWLEISGESAKGTLKGGIRGISIYGLTNYTATPAAVASAITTASFGVAEQAHLLRNGVINEVQFIENSEMLCLDASVSALSSFAGQVLIPIPIVGAVIGNAVGSMFYQIGKDSLSAKEKDLFNKYLEEINDFDQKLSAEYHFYIEQLNRCFEEFTELVSAAFDPDFEKAFEGSILLARYMRVTDDEILKDYDEVASYFLD